MSTIKTFCQPKFVLVILLAILTVLVVMSAGQHNVMAAGTGPCDIYASAGTPCVAAHSTVRALYGSYSGNLYQVRRASDNTTRDIPVLTAGGYANTSVQDSFCAGTTCTISILYDQSSQHNDLRKAPPGATWLPNGGNESSATKGKATVGGHTVYGIYVTGYSDNVAYRNNSTTGIATGNQAESMYMVVDGRRYSSSCCFDYGNAETNSKDNGNGTMEALYFGTDIAWGGQGDGNGPWIAADLENGMFKGNAGCYNCYPGPWPSAKSLAYNFVTAILKGPAANTFTLKGGNAQSGALTTMWNGSRPSPNYYPKSLEGAIILGTGGDGSNGGTGTFFEGAMTIGNPPDAIDDAIQANIIAAGYGSTIQPTTAPPTNIPPTSSPNGTVSINAGGAATGSFVADQYFSGGSTYTNTATIDMSQITTNPPPAAIFNTERYGAMTYTLPNRSGAQTVTLYFSENYVTAAGQRLFNVSINGATALSNFDIYASAGGQNRAIARTFNTTANSSGQVVIQFTAVTENPKISGITVTAGGVNPTQVPPTSVPPTSVPPTGVPPTSISINAGGAATGSFTADQYFSGGSTYTNTATIDMSQITTNPPPAAIFNTERYGAMTYTVPNRSGAQTVTLYFAETYVTAAGQRLFNVSINGAAALSNFDIYASAGGANRAIARTFNTTANSSGQVVIQFTAVTENPKINGITVAAGGPQPTTVPPTSVPPTGVPPTGAPPTGAPPASISINAGGAATGSFTADQYFSGGSTYTNTRTINMSQITTNPPPVAVFSTERYGAMTYTIPNLTAGRTYTVTLYFAETYVTAAGQRLFNVSINGATVLSSFDIYASAGGVDRAIARSFTTTANGSGQVVIQFISGTQSPKINGITVAG